MCDKPDPARVFNGVGRRVDVHADHASGRWAGLRRTPQWPVSSERTCLLAASLGAVLGGVLAGPVAAVVAAGYAALGARALHRRQVVRAAELLRRRRLDQLGALAADLRAGLPVPVVLPGADVPQPATAVASCSTRRRPGRKERLARLAGLDRIDRLARAATGLADRTGAPLAELVERIEADMRAMDRGVAAAAAQAAGARATAMLLAALPLGGIALGYGVGVDPVAVLLDTPIGAGCAIGAGGLQAAGLLWAERLSAAPGRST